ncbi:MAG: bifunctional UDP-N-acetylglucosamine diphosphorylase/glucosamine-1-phosphate N-acetyltransferase GlmU [Bdellovibrionales bacterium]
MSQKHLGKLSAIVLAAGKGTRMKSPLPKVLHPVAGLPLLTYPLSVMRSLEIDDVRVIVGHGKDLVTQLVNSLGFSVYEQKEQKGTGDAVKSADLDTLEGEVIILNGDHPLITAQDLKQAVTQFRNEKAALAVITADLSQPGNYGRIVRQGNQLKAIVEAKDASSSTLEIKEINSGIYIAKADVLKKYLPKIESANAQGEYYLTDIIELCVADSLTVIPIKTDPRLAFGVNSQRELATATKSLMKSKVNQLLDDGVIMTDPDSVYIEPTVSVDAGVILQPNVYLRGSTKIGSFAVIDTGSIVIDSIIGNGVQVKAYSHIEKASIGKTTQVGPYARIRPESHIGEDCKIGNFVETKKITMKNKSKASHLTYLGDAEIGEDVNIGCGTITCNYAPDKQKYKTIIGDGAFIGSDSQFIAPVSIGDHAVIGSGSVITKDVPDHALSVTRAKQFIKDNYVAEKKD